jgi:hypothetical protein
MEIPQNTKTRTTILSSNTTPGHIYIKEYKSRYNKDTCTSMFIAALFTIAKIWKLLRFYIYI